MHLQLNTLPRDVGYDVDDVPSCAKGTRLKLLEDIKSWILDTGLNSSSLLFLEGLPGTGKSAVARSVALWAQTHDILGAQVYLRRKDVTFPETAISFLVRNLAYAPCASDLRDEIANSCQQYCGDLSDVKALVDHWILGPLSNAEISDARTIVIVVDSLDSLGEQIATDNLEAMLRIRRDKLPFAFKILLTSRPPSERQTSILGEYAVRKLTMSGYGRSTREDVRSFISSSFQELSEMEEYYWIEEGWFTDEEVGILVDRAGDTFGVAADFVELVVDERNLTLCPPRESLDIILGCKPQPSLYPIMDSRYLEILETIKAGPQRSRNSGTIRPKWFQNVVGVIVVSREQIFTSDDLAYFANLGRTFVTQVLDCLRPVLTSGTLPTLDPWFMAFACESSRCTDAEMLVDKKVHHRTMALRCLPLIGGPKPEMSIRPPTGVSKATCVAYAERNWAYHLSLSGSDGGRALEPIGEPTLRNLVQAQLAQASGRDDLGRLCEQCVVRACCLCTAIFT